HGASAHQLREWPAMGLYSRRVRVRDRVRHRRGPRPLHAPRTHRSTVYFQYRVHDARRGLRPLSPHHRPTETAPSAVSYDDGCRRNRRIGPSLCPAWAAEVNPPGRGPPPPHGWTGRHRQGTTRARLPAHIDRRCGARGVSMVRGTWCDRCTGPTRAATARRGHRRRSMKRTASHGKPIPRLPGGLPGLGHAFEFRRDPVRLIQRGRDLYRDIFGFRLFGRRVHVLTGAAGNEAFFKAPDAVLSAREAYQFTVPIFGKSVAYDATPDLMDQQLRMVHPALCDERMQSYVQFISAEIEDHLEGWGDSGTLDLLTTMNEITIRSVYSRRVRVRDRVRHRRGPRPLHAPRTQAATQTSLGLCKPGRNDRNQNQGHYGGDTRSRTNGCGQKLPTSI